MLRKRNPVGQGLLLARNITALSQHASYKVSILWRNPVIPSAGATRPRYTGLNLTAPRAERWGLRLPRIPLPVRTQSSNLKHRTDIAILGFLLAALTSVLRLFQRNMSTSANKPCLGLAYCRNKLSKYMTRFMITDDDSKRCNLSDKGTPAQGDPSV